MRITLDCRGLPGGYNTGERGRFIADCLLLLMKEKAGLDCFFLSNRHDDPILSSFIPGDKLISPKSVFGRVGLRLGMGPKLPEILKNYRVDFLIGYPGIVQASLPVPFGLWLPGQSIPAEPGKWKRGWQRVLMQAAVVFTDSEFHRLSLNEGFSFPKDKVVVVEGAADENFRPLTGKERERVQEQYTGAKEYFIITQDRPQPDELIHLLKSFSFFKKKQQSNMQLVITGADEGTQQQFSSRRETFRFRDDLHFFNRLPEPESARLLAAAYGFLQPFASSSALSLLNAFQARIPVIATDQGANREIAGHAALYTASKDHEELGAKMILLYKDENRRNELIEKGLIRLQEFGWEKSIMQLWDGIQRGVQRGSLNHFS